MRRRPTLSHSFSVGHSKEYVKELAVTSLLSPHYLRSGVHPVHNKALNIWCSGCSPAHYPFEGSRGEGMPRIVRSSLIQATNVAPPSASLAETKKAMVDKHVG